MKRTVALFLGFCILVLAPAAAQEITSEQAEFFEKKIRPVLAESCYECHNSVHKKKGKLALDWRAPILESKVIVPGKPEESPLIKAIRHLEDYEPMPSKAPKLANVIIKNFEDWIRMGAPDPRHRKPSKEELASEVDWDAIRDKRAEWWSFQPVKKTTAPKVDDGAWNETAIDRFIYAGMQAKGLEAQREASPGALVRRLHLILTGLPPRPDVVVAYVKDPSERAYAKLVDDLMASQQYGERWGRYWLDWFRYAESYGSEGDPNVPYATQYRDYVVRALNDDVPYDQLLREAVAGDLLENPRINEEKGLNESAIGPAHLRMVPHGFGVTDTYDEQITFTDNAVDVLSKAMLGLTISCARCHNHKFDPISQKDFYKFYGIMVSSRPAIINVDSPKLQILHQKELGVLKATVRAGFAAQWTEELESAMEKLESAKLGTIAETDPLGGFAKLQGLDPAALRSELEAMRTRYREGLAHNERVKAEATFYADLREQATYDQWYKSGNGLGAKVSAAGSFVVAPEGGKVFTGIYPAGVYSHMISDKHSATLNSPFHLAKGSRNSIRAMGSGSIARFTLRSYPLSHGGLHPAARLKPKAGWVNLNKYKYWNGEKGYYNLNTGPDSTYRGGGNPRSWFGVFEVYAGDDSLRELGAPMVALPGRLEAITDRKLLLEFYRLSLVEALKGWSDGRVSDAQAQLLNAFVSRGFLASEVGKLPAELKTVVETYRKLEAEIRNPARAPGVMEGEPWDQPLLTRGNYKLEEEPVERGFLEVFEGTTYSKKSSGRRELAEDLVSERNTLSNRVIVNRLWHHTFGRGLVASADNFGRLGKEPSHPELLDHLASDFRENGWSMKRTVRQLVMSRTFRSESLEPAANTGKDSANVQLAYYPPRRLDAEAILDTIRFVAANKVGQRAIYKGQKRNGLDPFLSAFNYPIPTTTVGVRNVTNVPAQALMLMNGETTRRAAQEWSKRIRGMAELKTDEDRLNDFFMQAYSRSATPAEIEACLSYLQSQTSDDTPELESKRQELLRLVTLARKGREELVAPVRKKLQVEVDGRNRAKEKTAPKHVDLKPIGRWDFEGDARDSIGGMHGEIKGGAKVLEGALFLRGGGMWTKPLNRDLKEMTLEVLVQLDEGEQRGGGAMTVQRVSGKNFDGIVYAEVDARTWLSGSDKHKRTASFGGSPDQEADQRPVRMMIVYQADGTTRAYRDGKPYGKPFQMVREIYKKGQSQVVFGMRHGIAPMGGRALTGRIFEARLYDRVLTPGEVVAASSGKLLEVVTEGMLSKALSATKKRELADHERKIAALSDEVSLLEHELSQSRKARNSAGDPYYRIAHAILNSKELIYVY